LIFICSYCSAANDESSATPATRRGKAGFGAARCSAWLGGVVNLAAKLLG
jgi:hypothetical protein